MTWKGWMLALGRAVAYAVVTVVVFLAVIIALSGPSQEERRTTAKNVSRLVEESQKNRQILCLTIVRGAEDPAELDPDLLDLCGEVGVEPVAGEPMLVPLPFLPQPAPTPSPEPPAPSVSPSPEGPSPTPSAAPTPSAEPSVSLPPLPTPSVCLPLICEEDE